MNTSETTQRLVTADRLQDLPEPVRRYMGYTGVVGKPWIDTARIRYAGRFRMAADKPWMPIRAEQFYTTDPPAFHWKARFKMAGLWLMSADNTYSGGHGRMFGKVAGLIKVVDFRGDELDQGTMLRYLNEMTWFPTAFLGDNIAWQAVDDRLRRRHLHRWRQERLGPPVLRRRGAADGLRRAALSRKQGQLHTRHLVHADDEIRRAR